MSHEISPDEYNRIHEAANKINKLRDHAEIMSQMGYEAQGDPMTGDPYWDQAYFARRDEAMARIRWIESTLPSWEKPKDSENTK